LQFAGLASFCQKWFKPHLELSLETAALWTMSIHYLVEYIKAKERIQCLPGNSGLLDSNSARMQPTDHTST